MNLTKHGKKRVKQRLSGHADYFEEALKLGIRPADVSGNFKKYLDSLSLKHSRCSVVVYKNFVFLFNPTNQCLITTFSIPNQFHKVTKKINKRIEEVVEVVE